MKKNIILYVLGLGALYFFTRKSNTTTTTTTEDAGTPDLGNGSNAPTPSGPQVSTPPVEVLKPSTQPVVVNRASTPEIEQVMYTSTSPSMGEPKNVYSM